MYQLVMLVNIFSCVCIIALVLVQQGKGATMGAAFGSGASQTVFGSRGSGSFLFRLTMGFAAVFFMTSILLGYMATHAYKQERVVTLPVTPAPATTTMPSVPVSTAPAVPGSNTGSDTNQQ